MVRRVLIGAAASAVVVMVALTTEPITWLVLAAAARLAVGIARATGHWPRAPAQPQRTRYGPT